MEGGSVQIFLRLRRTCEEKKIDSRGLTQAGASYFDITNSTDKMIVLDKTPYIFDHIFYPSCSQLEVFQTMVI